jgi:hypothetical protein
VPDGKIVPIRDGECPATTVPADLEAAIRRVADGVHRLNLAITQAVAAGATIELLRCSRFHAGDGRWGDQMVPIVTLTPPVR